MGKKRYLYFIYTWSLYSVRFIKDQSLFFLFEVNLGSVMHAFKLL